ncbi:MAG: type IV secretion system DNA-binding domain-containing protein [Patescibacteria group bacterium]|nr:type IV secretion system DNA-binding domain-containing protein [Patescibacteria group bacterium]
MSNEIAVFAETTFRNEYKKFGIKTDDRRRHMYLIGKTGMGKSTILENMIVGDIRAGHGVAIVDPHGDLAEKIIEFIPEERIKDVIYFNPADMDFPIAFNVLEQVEPHLRHLVASGLLGVFQKLWADSWGPRLEYILRNTILAILDFPGSTILGVVRMLSDKTYRKKVVANIKDPVVKAFWEKEFASYADKFASEAVSPIQNKVGQFLSSSLMRNIIGQVDSAINIREIMDSGKILIMNLSKGRIGEDNSALLGAMMITKIQLSAMSRVDMPEKERKDFYLYIDEFQNFSTDSFANILSEARKYHLNLILAHQYIEQLSEKVKPAVFGNVGTMVSFRVGSVDAEELAKEFAPVFTEEDLVNLPKYEMYLKLMIDGVASSPFSAKGLPPLTDAEITNNTEKVIQYSREKYASSREDVEEKILRWHSAEEDAPKNSVKTNNVSNGQNRPHATNTSSSPSTPAASLSRPAPIINNERLNPRKEAVANTVPKKDLEVEARIEPVKNTTREDNVTRNQGALSGREKVNSSHPGLVRDKRPQFKAICARCGIETATVFEPDGIRPVFCKECLSIKRQEKKSDLENRQQQKAEELKKIDSVPSISLSSLSRVQPVDFRGRPEKKHEDRLSNVNNTIFNKDKQEIEIDEDEVIDFSRRAE